MTNTQRLEQGIPPLEDPVDLAGILSAVVQHARRSAAELWNELRQWG